jgi:hypothetical protein
MKADRWGAKHDREQEQDGEADLIKHEDNSCNPCTCDYCISERDRAHKPGQGKSKNERGEN